MNSHKAPQPDFIGVVLIPVGTAFVGVGAVQTAASQRNVWSSPWFDVGFAMVALGVLLVVSWRWRMRRVRRAPNSVSPLLLRAEKGDWRLFGNAVWTFRIPVRVTNTTGEAITIVHYHLQSTPDAALRPPVSQEAWNAVSSWLATFSSEHESDLFAGEIVVPPGESIMRWFASWVYARLPDGGRPALTLQIKDILNNTYELKLPAHPPETYPSP